MALVCCPSCHRENSPSRRYSSWCKTWGAFAEERKGDMHGAREKLRAAQLGAFTPESIEGPAPTARGRYQSTQ